MIPRSTINDYGTSLHFCSTSDSSTQSFSTSSLHQDQGSSLTPSISLSSTFPLQSFASTSLLPTLPGVSTIAAQGNVEKLVLLFKLLYPTLDGSSLPYPLFDQTPKLRSTIRKFIHYAKEDTDMRSIFRDLATSRAHSLQPGGPWDAKNLRTSAGFFSALICRGILHNSSYIKDPANPVYFADLDAWNTVRHSPLGDRGESYFCNKRAYSERPSGKRTSSYAARYWNTATNTEYSSFLSTQSPMSFLKLWKLLRDKKHVYWEEENGVCQRHELKVFPEFGSLQAYLLASDYAIAGVVTMPTFTEMAEVIHAIDSGGLHGLQQLELPCSIQEQTASSLRYLHDYLIQEIAPQRQQQMHFNIFVVEHTLCKYSSSKRLNTATFSDIVHFIDEVSSVGQYSLCSVSPITDFFP